MVECDWISLFLPDPAEAAKRQAATTDGVVLLSGTFSPIPYLTAYSRHTKALGRRLLLAGGSFLDPGNLAPKGIDLSGVVVGGSIPLDSDVPALKRFHTAIREAFPQLSPSPSTDAVTLPVYTSMEAVVEALDASGGKIGERQRAFRDELSSLVLDAPQGRVRLDGDRQAVAPIYLDRIEPGRAGAVSSRWVRRLDGVEHTFGGIFTLQTPSPSATDPACVRRQLPPWAG